MGNGQASEQIIGAAREPLANHASFGSRDLASFRRYLAHSYCDHHISQLEPAEPVYASHNRVGLSELSLNYLRYGADVEIDIGPFNTFYMFEFPRSGSVDLDLGSHQIQTRPGFAAVISPTMPVWSHWSKDCEQMMVKIAKSALEQHLSQLIGRSLPYDLLFEPLIDFEKPEAQSLLRFTSFLFDQFDNASPLLSSRGISKDIEHAFMSTLLLGQPNNYSDLLRARSNSVAPRHVRRAIEFIEKNLRNEIGIDELVAVSATSARALYAGFNKFVGMPPQALIKNRRLDCARQDLMEGEGDTTVAEIAMRWQFCHLGRFSSEYRKRFGESPRETLRH